MFQSTRPVRGATYIGVVQDDGRIVSIHAPREGRDLSTSIARAVAKRFQSTRPVRGATHFPRR